MTVTLNGLRMKCVEPVKRNKDGLRWVEHRFPIKGGISLCEAWIKDLSRPISPHWDRIFRRSKEAGDGSRRDV